MDPITNEVYREYLCNRLKDLTECLDHPVPINDRFKLRLEIQRDIDYIMQQLYLLDNESEE
ncbi:MAG: hypothetical protein IJN11_00055 [Oscillospiraceae bacterium]|nr:hypothetical protein [Oscillospiraceae bacterium]